MAALRESGEALIRKHGFTPEQHQEHIDDLIDRFRNRSLGDTVFRVARDPVRKLGHNDRLVGAARLALEHDVEPTRLVKGIASALRYNHPEDEKAAGLQKMLRERGLPAVLEEVCGLEPGSALFELITAEL